MKSKSELKIQITAYVLIHTCLVDFKGDGCIAETRFRIRSSSVAGGVGFEPTTASLGGWRPIRTRLPALKNSRDKVNFNLMHHHMQKT